MRDRRSYLGLPFEMKGRRNGQRFRRTVLMDFARSQNFSCGRAVTQSDIFVYTTRPSSGEFFHQQLAAVCSHVQMREMPL